RFVMPLSRRGFIHSSLGLAAGTAFTGGLPAFGALQSNGANAPAADADKQDKPQGDDEVKKAPPSERLRMAVIGCGGRAESHVDAWSGMQDVELVALCDPDGAR